MSRVFPLFFSTLCISSTTLLQRPSYKAKYIASSSLYCQCYLCIYVPQMSEEEKQLNRRRQVLKHFLRGRGKLEQSFLTESHLHSRTDFLRYPVTSTHARFRKRSEGPALYRAWKDSWYDVETFQLKSKPKTDRKREGASTFCSHPLSDVLSGWRAAAVISSQGSYTVYPQSRVAAEARGALYSLTTGRHTVKNSVRSFRKEQN